MTDIVRGIKAGIVAGIIFGPLSIFVSFFITSSSFGSIYPSNILNSYLLLIVLYSLISGIIYGVILGLIVGVIYGALYAKLPGSLSYVKALMLSLFLWLIFSVGFVSLLWSSNRTYYSRYYETNLISGLILFVFFSFILGFFWDRFKGGEKRCPSCQKNIPREVKICPYCGITLITETPTKRTETPAQTSNSLSIIIIGVAVVITVLIVVIFAAFTFYQTVSRDSPPLREYHSTPVSPPPLPVSSPPLPFTKSNWSYYRILPINNPQREYQMKIIVGNTSGGNVSCLGHCNQDFSDIRFVDIDNATELPYWLEEYVVGQTATFWVKLPVDIEVDKKILIYYGHRNCSTTSNGDTTFIFFDDFETNLHKWVLDTQCSYAMVIRSMGMVSGGHWSAYICTTFGECRAIMYHNQSIHDNVTIEFDWAPRAGESNYQVFHAKELQTGNTVGNLYATAQEEPYHFQYYDGILHTLPATYTTPIIYTGSTWHHIREDYNFFSQTYDIYIDGVLQQKNASFNLTTASIDQLQFYSGAGSQQGEQYVDTFIVRKWVVPEPIWGTIGFERKP